MAVIHHLKEFIKDMELAYSAADIIVSRAGAIAISELAVAQKPVLLVPFPFAAEDHQTKNAMALVNRGAALLVKDSDAKVQLIHTALELLNNKTQQVTLTNNISTMAFHNSANVIALEVLKLANYKVSDE